MCYNTDYNILATLFALKKTIEVKKIAVVLISYPEQLEKHLHSTQGSTSIFSYSLLPLQSILPYSILH